MPARDPELQRQFEQVRAALVDAAVAAYEDARVRGLCGEGAFEVAVAAMQKLHLSGTTQPTKPQDLPRRKQ
jgi:hypothetical protein